MDDRKQLKIFVSDVAKRAVEEFAAEFDMTEQGVASRIYEWFGRLPRPAQKWITGLTNGSEGEGMKLFAQALLRGKAPHMKIAAKKLPPPQS